MKSDLIDVSAQLHHRTAKAVLVSSDGERDEAIWLPLSQIEITGPDKHGVVEITLPEWLAKDKGLI